MFSCQGLPSFRPLSPLKTVPFLCPCQGPSLHYTTVFLETFPFIIISMSRNNPSLDTFFLETVHIMFPCKWNCYQRTPLPLDHLFHKTYPYIFTWKLTSHHGPPIIWTTFFLDKQTRGGHRKACCSRPIKALTYMSWSFLQTMDLDVHGRKVLHCHNIINCSVLIHFTTLWNEILQSLHYHHGHLKTCSATVYTVEQSWQTFKVTAVTEPFYRSINEQKQRNKQTKKTQTSRLTSGLYHGHHTGLVQVTNDEVTGLEIQALFCRGGANDQLVKAGVEFRHHLRDLAFRHPWREEERRRQITTYTWMKNNNLFIDED